MFFLKGEEANLQQKVIMLYSLSITSLNGTVQKNPNYSEYARMSSVVLTATPDTDYVFAYWSGDIPQQQVYENPTTIVMDSNKNITAHFVTGSGSIKCYLQPSAVQNAGKWRRVGASVWRDYGETINNIPCGPQQVEFKPVADYDTPANGSIFVMPSQTAEITGTYLAKPGSVKINLTPQQAINDGARWRRVGASTWQNSGATITNIAAGNHEIEFNSVTGCIDNENLPIVVSPNQLTEHNVEYQRAQYMLELLYAEHGSAQADPSNQIQCMIMGQR